jgi:hypothetical protein
MKQLSTSLSFLWIGFILQSYVLSSKRDAYLDSEDKYHVSWEVVDGNITFEVTVNTTGFIGFGISERGSMAGADIIIGGVSADFKQPYFTVSVTRSNSSSWKCQPLSMLSIIIWLSFFKSICKTNNTGSI